MAPAPKYTVRFGADGRGPVSIVDSQGVDIAGLLPITKIVATCEAWKLTTVTVELCRVGAEAEIAIPLRLTGRTLAELRAARSLIDEAIERQAEAERTEDGA